MMIVAVQIDMEAPLETVWFVVTDPDEFSLWRPEVVETSYPDVYDRANPVGTRFRQTIRLAGRQKIWLGEVIACEPLRLYATRVGDGLFHVDLHYRLIPMGTGTRLDCEVNMGGAGLLLRAGGFLLRPVARRVLHRHMDNLKCLTEDTAVGLVQTA